MFSSNTSQVSGGYEIQRSLRFNSADSAYLNRTPASAGNRRTWTYSGWVKLSNLSSSRVTLLMQYLANTDAGYLCASIVSDTFGNNIIVEGYNTIFRRTTAAYRDFSAWYHVVIAVDTTQATANNRIRLYINGSEVTAFQTTNNPAQNDDTAINSTGAGYIGQEVVGGQYSNAYFTETYLIDGQALTPSSFGAFDAQTGVWGPTPYGGSYGTNGFYLNFSDNSNTTAATLGKDYSGNGNNWTPNNFSVSAGAGNDSLVDVPTNWGTDTGVGGTVRGNYCTLNPLYGTPAPTNGNLEVTVGNTTAYGSMSFTSGKWYWEVTPTVASGDLYIGVMNSGYIKTDGAWGSSTARTYVSNGTTFGSGGGTYGASYTANDIIGIALDMDAGSITFYKNGTSQGTAFTNLGGDEWRSLVYATGTSTFVCNFGQRPFAYTAPSGFKALNTQNLPTPTIGATTATQAGKFFNPVLYTGNGFPTSGTQSVSGVGFQPDWVWIKSRSSAGGNTVTDVVRGINSQLLTNTTGAQETNTDNITAFNSDGFSLGSNTTGSTSVNVNGQTYVAWNWKANGAGVTNTAGSITSTVSANTTSGFSVVTFTASANSGTIGHGLGVAPKFIILKSRNNTSNWVCYHASLGADKYINLDGTGAAITNTATWQNTTPTSTVFSSNGPFLTGWTEVAYCFAEVPGFSKFGSYTGNGSADGVFVYTGFKPRWILIKLSSGSYDWILWDTARNTFNVSESVLWPNLSNAEYVGSVVAIDILSNGFKCRTSSNTLNGSGSTYIFAAFAEAPQKFSLAR